MSNKFGEKIKEFRRLRGLTSQELAGKLSVSRSYLARLENGYDKPSQEFLRKLSKNLSLSDEQAKQIWDLAGYTSSGFIIDRENRKGVVEEVNNGEVETGKEMKKEIQVSMKDVPVLYSDSAFVTANQFGIVFDFAQSIGSTNNQNVVARIGMSIDHARALSEVLRKRLEGKKKPN
jgi:transcriptional regulator with XRE-family HTH domain